jgi:hypothetical protein
MSSKTKSAQDLFPNGIDPAALQKGLGCGANLLARNVPKRPNPGFQPRTGPKLLNMVAMQMAAKCNAGAAQEFLNLFQEAITTFSKAVLATPNPAETLAEVASTLSRESPPAVFSVSPPTLSAHLDRYPIEVANAALCEQLDVLSELEHKQGTWPAELMLAADPTDIVYRGRFYNQYTSYGQTGNQPTWKRGFKEFGIYACPTQLQVGFAPLLVGSNSGGGVPAWVCHMADAVKWATSTGSTVSIIAVDREFYSATSFAAAHIGLFAPELAPEDQPRLLCPTKFWRAKDNRKWEFLVGKKSADVAEATLELSATDAKRLGPAAASLLGEDGKYRVPVAMVAGFDSYPGRRAPKSIEWAKIEAKRIDQQLRAAQAELARAKQAYEAYATDKAGNPRVAPRKVAKKRQFFGDQEDAARYWAYLEAKKAVPKWEEKKARLCKRLAFFTASLREGERVKGHEAEFSDLIRQYREHWNIENGYKSQKWQFRLRTNSRKTTARHVRAVLGAMFYNAWHYRRVSRAVRLMKESEPGWKPFDGSVPPVRKKWERKIRPALSAQGFLMEELKLSLQVSIKLFVAQIKLV